MSATPPLSPPGPSSGVDVSLERSVAHSTERAAGGPADRPIDWALVRSFLAVLDAGSLMAAARRGGRSQPTLSRHIAQLEAQVGAPLFERGGRGATPTALALAIGEAARRMQGAADDLALTLAGQRQRRSGIVRLSASQVAAHDLLPPLLVALQQAEPEIQIELVASNDQSNLLRREADIALRMLRPTQAALVARKLGEVPVFACAHRDYLARAGRPAGPAELMQHRLIGYDRDDTLLRGFAALGWPVTREHFVLRTDDHLTYGQLVAAGGGIGFAVPYAMAKWPGVERVLPSLTIPPLPCWLVVHREIQGSPLIRRVFDHLAEAVPPALAIGAG